MPLTMTIELMAEAAASLMPGKIVVEMHDISASKWLTVDAARVTLRTTASVNAASGSASEVRVHVDLAGYTPVSGPPRESSSSGQSNVAEPRIAECVVVLAERYPEPPPVTVFAPRSPRPSTWLPDRLYRDHMFHGPSFRGITAIETSAENGSTATLCALPRSPLFATVQNPTFLIEPILLDAAGQLIGYWAAENLPKKFNVFPHRVKSVQLFGPALAEGQSVACQTHIRLVDDAQIHADLEIAGPQGRALQRVLGWEDVRVDFPDAFYRMCISARGVVLSSECDLPVAVAEGAGHARCCMLAASSLPSLKAHGGIWLQALAHLVLGRREREVWRALSGPERRRIQWLLGRCCAKDAVRALLRDSGGPELLAADIEIVADENGRPMIADRFAGNVRPAISIAHTDGLAVALASEDRRPGVDIETARIDRDAFEEAAFTKRERALIDDAAAASSSGREAGRHHRLDHALGLWCAKEATAKAIGYGLVGGPGALRVDEYDAASGRACLKVAGALAERCPHLRDIALVAHIVRTGDLVTAFCLDRRVMNETA
jgi:phosphopantetheinyl transferase